MNKSKGQLQSEITEAMIKFEKEFMGRGPLEAKTYIIDDMIIVRLQGVLTQAELQLAKSTDNNKGRELIKQIRVELLEKGRPLLEAVIQSIIGYEVKSLHSDLSTLTGERIIIFTLDGLPFEP